MYSIELQFFFTKLRPLKADKTGFNLIIFYFNIRGKLSIIRCDKYIFHVAARKFHSNDYYNKMRTIRNININTLNKKNYCTKFFKRIYIVKYTFFLTYYNEIYVNSVKFISKTDHKRTLKFWIKG